MPDIKSHNSETSTLTRQLLVPDPIEMVLYLLSSIVFLLASNAKAVWDYLSLDPAGQQKAFSLVNGSSSSSNSGILGTSLQGRIGQVVIWGLVGVAIYTVIWFIKNIATNLRNDFVADEFVHPHSYNRAKYWESIIIRKSFFTFISLVLAGYIYLLYKIIPVLSSMFFFGTHKLDQHHTVQLVGSVSALTILMHVFVVLVRMTINSWRFIYADL